MAIGQYLRRLLGPSVDPVARLYRSYYVNLESFARSLGNLEGVSSVLEIGCGDGHLCEALAAEFSEAAVLGIDIATNPGSLYKGRPEGVDFRQVAADALLVDKADRFDLVVLCDVLHHVPIRDRQSLVGTAWNLTSLGGHLAVKDWVSSRNLATGLAYLSDRHITGDPPSIFPIADELKKLIAYPGGTRLVVDDGSVPPHKNNVYFIARKQSID